MDYIAGDCLASCWNDLNPLKRQKVVAQVAEMIQELQSVQLKHPGPIGGGPCQGKWFTDYSAGPFASRQEMEDWFNHKLNICKATGNAKKSIPPFKFPTFVLTHQDISPRNLILDTSGYAWLIDWGFAGAYPPAFEAATLTQQHQFRDFNRQVLQQIDYNTEHVEHLRSIGWGLWVAALA